MTVETDRFGREMVVPLRLNSLVVISVGVLAFLGALLLALFRGFPSPPPPIYTWLPLSFCIIALSLVPACIFYRCHARLIVSDTGLRWRTWGEWKRAAWDGVRDYYDRPPSSEGSGDLMTIETEAGNITLNRRWRESDGVRQVVQERARQTETAEWGILGQRASRIDARVFAYRQNEPWIMIIIGSMVILPYTVFGWHWLMMMHPKAGSVWKVLNNGWIPGNLWGSLTADAPLALSGLFLAYLITYPLLLLVAQMPGLFDMDRRRAERITTRRSRITFDDGRQQITAAWDEVTGYFLEPSLLSQLPFLRVTALTLLVPPRKTNWYWVFVIETQQGNFQYSGLIDGWQQLDAIIKERTMPLKKRKGATR